MLYRCLAALVLSVATVAPVMAEDELVLSRPEAAERTPATAAEQGEAPPPQGGQSAVNIVQPAPAAKADAAPQSSQTSTAAPATPVTPSATADMSKAEPASEPTETSTAAAENGQLDAIPAGADPLTPPPDDSAPARAPGAPQRPAAAHAEIETDPFISALRARLAEWPEGRAKSDRDDLAALKSYYAEIDALRLWTTADGLSPRAKGALKTFARADEWGLDSSAFEAPAQPSSGAPPDALVDVEIRVGLEVLKYARFARGGRVDPSSVSGTIDMRPRLYEPRSVIEALAEAADVDAYLEGLHPRHAGFVALKGALADLRGSASGLSVSGEKPSAKRTISSEERRIVANMERWRWLPDDLGAFHIIDNIPEQIVRVVHNGKIVHQAKIVVGKPSTPTPIFSMPMRFVIFHPTWGVPDGIKSNELAPMLRRAQANSSSWFFSQNDGASRALQRHQLRVYSGGREIHPDSINWASTDIRRYSFIQPASRSNVLGLVKFRFPNKHDVYMHDTSERHLFGRQARAFSHGCMRVEDPLKLAELILAYDKGWSRGRIDQIISRGATHDVTLEKKVNVHISYFTAAVGADGKLRSYPDIYGIDSRTASALAGRSVVLSSAKTDDEVKPTQTRPRPASASQSKRRQASTEQKPSVPKPWNPFNQTAGN